MALATFIEQNQGNLNALSNFIVDNNPQGVFAVLRANGYSFNTNGEAAVIVKSLLGASDSVSAGIVSQLSVVPYLNNATNGTGGLKPTSNGGMQTLGAGDDLLCLGSKLFGLSIGCPPAPGVAETEAQRLAREAAAKEAADKAQRTTYIIIGVAAVLLIITVIYFTSKTKTAKAA